MCKYHNAHDKLLKLSNLYVKPSNILLIRFVVRVDVLIVNNKEIIEPKTDYYIDFGQDRKEETVSKNGDVGVLYPVDYTIEQDKVPEQDVVTDVLLKVHRMSRVSCQFE